MYVPSGCPPCVAPGDSIPPATLHLSTDGHTSTAVRTMAPVGRAMKQSGATPEGQAGDLLVECANRAAKERCSSSAKVRMRWDLRGNRS